jgi:PKD repeat protein
MTRVSSADLGYIAGDLSTFPLAVDTKETLYEVRNNAATTLKQTLPINGTYIVVYDASIFPPMGLIRLGPHGSVIPSMMPPSDLLNSNIPGVSGDSELIYYGSRTDNTFKELQRGYAGSRQNQWATETPVSSSVMAETHNSIKDAIINMENYIGTQLNPAIGTINSNLNILENKYLAPNVLFRSYPTSGKPPLTVNFHNLGASNTERFLWDFGDGITSTDKNPTHIYTNEGIYTITLNIITNTNAQGITTKNNYISVSNDLSPVFFYSVVDPDDSNIYNFVDQTDGAIVERIWVFGDGITETITDPNVHTTSHTYTSGSYVPNILVTLENQITKRGYSSTTIIVT